MTESKEISIVWFLLRFGVAFTFLYASISAFANPDPWLGYFPGFIRDRASDLMLLYTWGTGEFIIGLWLLSGYRIFIPSIAASSLMLGIFIFNFYSLYITFRNVAILCTSIALAIMSNPHYIFRLTHSGKRAAETHTIKTVGGQASTLQ